MTDGYIANVPPAVPAGTITNPQAPDLQTPSSTAARLLDRTRATNGAGMVAFTPTLNYPPWSVGGGIRSLSTSVSTALSTSNSGISSLSTSTSTVISSLSTGLSTTNSGLSSLSTSTSTGLSTAVSGLGSLSTSTSTGLSTATSSIGSLSTSTSTGLSTAVSGLSSISTSTSTGLSTAVSGVYSLSTSASTGISSLSTSTSTALSTASSSLAAANGAGLVGFQQAGTGAVVRTTLAKQRDAVSVKDFGAVSDGVTDDTAAVQAFFDYLATQYVGSADFDGNFLVTSKITISALLTPTVRCNATVKASFTAEDEVLLLQNSQGTNFTGRIVVICGGSATWTARTNGIGVRLYNMGRATIDYLEIQFSKYDGLVFDGAGNSSLTNIRVLRTLYCGAAQGATGRSVNFTARSESGSASSVGQRTTLTLDSAPALLSYAKFVRINGYPYAVMAVNLGLSTIDVYPWVDSAVLTGVVDIIGGAGLRASGGDNSMLNIGSHDAFVCGIGYRGDNLYPGIIGAFTSQSCGVAHTLGVATSGGCVGGGMGVAYFENNYFDLVLSTGAQLSYQIESTSALTLSKCVRLAPRNGSNVLLVNQTLFSGVNIGYNGARLSTQNFLPSGVSTLSMDGQPAPIAMGTANTSNSPTIALKAPIGGSAYPYQDLFFVTTGTGSNNAPSGTVTLTPDAGYSVNGGVAGVSAAFTGLIGATVWHAYLTGTNWRVSRIAMGDQLSGSATYDPASLVTGAGVTTTVTVTGAVLGDFVDVSFSLDLQGIQLTAGVSAADTVSVRFQNQTGGTLDLGSGTVRVRVRKK